MSTTQYSPSPRWTRLVSILCMILFATLTHANFIRKEFGLGPHVDALVTAFGDFNGDKHLDLFLARALENGQYAVEVHLYTGYGYQKQNFTHPIIESTEILGVIPGDFNYDGHLDVMTITKPAQSTQKGVVSKIWIGALRDFSAFNATTLEPAMMDIPLAFDSNNDLHVDFLADRADTSRRAVWRWTSNDATTGAPVYQVTDLTLPDLLTTSSKQLRVPASQATVDIDGDCLADLLVVSAATSSPNEASATLEVWRNAKEEVQTNFHYRLHAVYDLPRGAGQLSVGDVDMDGTIDIVIPQCYPLNTCSEDSAIHIISNKQIPMCASQINPGSSCRRQQDLCVADPNFKLGNISDPLDPHHTIVPTSYFLSRGMRLASHARPADNAPYFALDQPPLTVRLGDVDLDGYPELLVPVDYGSGNVGVTLWSSTQCTNELCTEAATANRQRTFADPANLFATDETVYAAAFADIGNGGRLDVIALVPKGGYVFQNNYEGDYYFLTTLGSNGVCPAWCTSGPEFPSPKPYGVNQMGVTFKFTVTDSSGSKGVRIATHLTQSAYLSLQTPYALSGLGRTSNYIEEFFAGFTIAGSRHDNMWIAMIPNSQLVVFPYPKGDSSSWLLELFISPSQRLVAVVIAFVSTLSVIGITILVLHWQEKRQDAAEKKSHQYLFTF